MIVHHHNHHNNLLQLVFSERVVGIHAILLPPESVITEICAFAIDFSCTARTEICVLRWGGGAQKVCCTV